MNVQLELDGNDEIIFLLELGGLFARRSIR